MNQNFSDGNESLISSGILFQTEHTCVLKKQKSMLYGEVQPRANHHVHEKLNNDDNPLLQDHSQSYKQIGNIDIFYGTTE